MKVHLIAKSDKQNFEESKRIDDYMSKVKKMGKANYEQTIMQQTQKIM